MENEDHILDVLNSKGAACRNFRQVFQPFDHQIEHSNLLQVTTQEEKNEALHIQNIYVEVVGDQLIKVTEIRFGNRVIKITDSFTCTPPSTSEGKKVPQQEKKIQKKEPQYKPYKKLIKKNNNWTTSEEEFKVRDTKNIVKNIFRLFQNWVQHLEPPNLSLSNLLKKFLKRNTHFNNSLIVGISRNEVLKKGFLSFVNQSGQQLIGKSRIVDKASHLQALTKYKEICQCSNQIHEDLSEDEDQ